MLPTSSLLWRLYLSIGLAVDGPMPGAFRSPIVRVRDGSESARVTIPDGVAKVLGAEVGGFLVWSVDLKAGRVSVSAEPPGAEAHQRSRAA